MVLGISCDLAYIRRGRGPVAFFYPEDWDLPSCPFGSDLCLINVFFGRGLEPFRLLQ